MDNPHVYKELDGEIIIPTVVLRELDNHKGSQNEKGKNIRDFAKILKQNQHNFKIFNSSKLESSNIKNDEVIIKVCKEFSASLVTSDIMMAEIAKSVGIKVIYPKDEKRSSIDLDFSGIFAGLIEIEDDSTVLENEFFRKGGRISRKFKNEARLLPKDIDVQGIKHKNMEQRLALDLLMDEDVKLVTLKGKAGCGKTLLAIASAVELLNKQKYNNILIARPTVSMGKEIGFLPGDIDEKLKPWMQPIYDNLSLFMKKDILAEYENSGKIKIESLSMIRGRSIANQIIIIDEAQNLTPHEIKTIVTRIGNGSKIIFTGDVEQIDNKDCDSVSNGLSYLIDSLKESYISGHITLNKSERSELAAITSELLK
jgi:PhoH-like ATPase